MHATPEERARRAYVTRTTASDGTRQRLRARLRDAREATRSPTSPSRSPLRLRWVGAVALTAAAAAGLAFLLRSDSVGGVDELPEYVQVRFDGEGSIGGTAKAPRLTWEAGTLHVDVEPNRGVDLTVTTDEAVVRVVGTAFDVHREHFATEVVVDHGRVAVTCVGEPERMLTDGQRIRCLPQALPALLRRVASLSAASADHEARLDALDRAAPLAEPGTPAHGELLAHRVQALADAGRSDEALQFTETYLDAGHATRRAELLSFLVHHRFEQAQCAIRSRLEEAVDTLPPGPTWLLLASCLTAEDPERARALLEEAAPAVEGGDWAAFARALADRLAARPPEAPPR